MSLLVVLVGCQKGDAASASSEGDPAAAPKPSALPPLELTDQTGDLLLTWVDDLGDFHVVQKIDQVPEGHRKQVRVIVTTREEGRGTQVYVADLSAKRSDGSYQVGTLTRAQWDAIGADKRKARLEALAPSAKPPAAPPATGSPEGVEATIYGADWCKPCHDAEKLLKKLGVKVTKLNIEKSAAANREMQAKLAKANRGGSSIPVIDVAGQLFVGFNATALKRAVEDARNRETL